MKKTLITLLMVLLCAMLIMSCSNEPKDEGSSTTPTETPTETPTTPAEPTPSTYTVTFNSNGGSDVDATEVTGGEKVTKPANPTKDSSIFYKWTTDQAGNNEYNFESAVNDNITLYAKWISVGSSVNLGKYPENYTFNGSASSLAKQPISWKVLSVDVVNSRALVVSENVLEKRNDLGFTSYSGSSIQSYLNGDFITTYGLNNVSICNVNVTSNIEQTTISTTGTDKVFLLSKSEAENTSYFATQAARVAKYGNGAWQWTLRSVDSYMNVPYSVSTDGSISGYSFAALRPAMWVNF